MKIKIVKIGNLEEEIISQIKRIEEFIPFFEVYFFDGVSIKKREIQKSEYIISFLNK